MVLQSTNIVALMILFQMVYELMENSFRKVQTNLLKIFVLKDSLFWSYKVQTDAEIAGLKDKVATQQKLIDKLDGERIMKDTFLTDM